MNISFCGRAALAACSLWVAGLALSAAPVAAQDLVINAPHVFDGIDHVGARRLVIKDGRVVTMTSMAMPAPEGVPTLDLPAGARLMPGLCLADSVRLAPLNNDNESLTLTARASDAFDPFLPRKDWEASGVTSAWLSPGRARFMPGHGSVVRLHSDSTGFAVLAEGALHAVVTEEAYAPPAVYAGVVTGGPDQPVEPPKARYPRSRAGAFAELRRFFDAVKAGKDQLGTDSADRTISLAPLRAVLERQRPLRVRAELKEDILEAVALATEFNLDLIIEGGTESHLVARELGAIGAGVILRVGRSATAGWDPTEPFSSRRGESHPHAAGILKAKGVRVALVPPVDGAANDLLWFVAQAVGPQFTLQQALRAVTADAADLMQLGRAYGRVRQGAVADFVVYDRAQNQPDARPLLVIADGRIVHDARAERSVVAIDTPELHLGDGTVHRPGRVVIADGKILHAGERRLPIPVGARHVVTDRIVTPGFVALGAQRGVRTLQELDGVISKGPALGPIPLSKHITDSFDPELAELASVRASGVTSFALLPASKSGIAGRVAVVKTGGGTEAVVRKDAGLYLDLTGTGNRRDEISKFEKFLEKLEKYVSDWDAYREKLATFEKEQAKKAQEAQKAAAKAWPEDLQLGAITRPAETAMLSGVWSGTLAGVGIAGPTAITVTFEVKEENVVATVERGEAAALRLNGRLDGNVLTLRGDVGPRVLVARMRVLRHEMLGRYAVGTLDRALRLQRVDSAASSGEESEGGKGSEEEAAQKDKAEGKKPEKKNEASGKPKPPKVDENLEPLRDFFMAEVPLLFAFADKAVGRDLVKMARDRFELRTAIVGDAPIAGMESFLSDQAVAYAPGPGALKRGQKGEAPVVISAAARKVMTGFFVGADGEARGLYHAAAYAVRMGLPASTALKSLTQFPALILGVSDRVGTLKPGMDADLVLLDGGLFLPGTRVDRVMVDGRFCDEHRQEKP